MNIELRRCTVEDAPALRRLAIITYYETFAPKNTSENMDAFLQSAYDIRKLRSELADPNSEYFFLYVDGKLAGYLKLNEHPSQTDIHDPETLEVQRIYVYGKFQGMGLGRFLLNTALEIAAQRGKRYVWLGAWEHNERALRFYDRMGFRPVGTHPFVMGTDVQTDYIMRKDLC